MSRLSLYLTRQFFVEALALTAVVLPLLYLTQCFRIIDVITVKGQDFLTLLGQASLALPQIGSVFLYVCAAIGLARTLDAMQQSGELHTIHSSRRLGALFGATAIFTAVVTLVVLALSHLGSPLSLKRYDEWAASVAADLVGRALVPHRFAEVVPGVTVVIGGRQGDGRITDFFADDRRDPEQRRTYSAAEATVSRDDQGYVLQLKDGVLQYMTDELSFSQIGFRQYDLAVELLTDRPAASYNISSWTLVDNAIQAGVWTEYTLFLLIDRTSEGLRVIGICLLVLAIAGFPHGRRRAGVPIELLVLIFAFADRGFTTYAPQFLGILRPAAGAFAMMAAGAALLVYRLWLAQWVRWAVLNSIGRRA